MRISAASVVGFDQGSRNPSLRRENGIISVAAVAPNAADSPNIGFAKWQVTVDFCEPPMSAIGYKRTFQRQVKMSAFEGKADMAVDSADVRL